MIFRLSNETKVLESARHYVEYQQMEQRVRLDIPTLADPLVRDLLQESDMFSRSFSGGGFGVLSPLEVIHIIALSTEIISHLLVILSLTDDVAQLGILFVSILSASLPYVVAWLGISQDQSQDLYSTKEIRAADRQEKMRNLAYSDTHRAEVVLFGLGDWILNTWSNARKVVVTSEQNYQRRTSFRSRMNISDFLLALQNVSRSLFVSQRSARSDHLSVSPRANTPDSRCFAGFAEPVSNFNPIYHTRIQQYHHRIAHGIPGDIPDVCLLRWNEAEAEA